jgi:hypothetical protein
VEKKFIDNEKFREDWVSCGTFVLIDDWLIQTRVDAKRIETLGLSLSKPKATIIYSDRIPVERFDTFTSH